MTSSFPILKLIRLKNLVIIALTLFLMRYAIVQPILVIYGLSLELPFFYFNLIVISVLFIAAAGYMINDYFDQELDAVNKPDKVLIGRYFSANSIFYSYLILNLLAIFLAGYVSYKTNEMYLFIIYPVTVGVLWFYSTTYKKQLLLGNLLVGFMIGIVPLLPALHEIPLVNAKYRDYLLQTNLDVKIILAWTGAFSLFAFLITVLREIIKDVEDFEGDNTVFRNTLPIVFGIQVTKLIVYLLICIIVASLGLMYYFFLRINDNGTIDFVTMLYFLFLIIVPLIIVAVVVYNASTKKDYALATVIVKIIILTGMAYSIVVRFKII